MNPERSESGVVVYYVDARDALAAKDAEIAKLRAEVEAEKAEAAKWLSRFQTLVDASVVEDGGIVALQREIAAAREESAKLREERRIHIESIVEHSRQLSSARSALSAARAALDREREALAVGDRVRHTLGGMEGVVVKLPDTVSVLYDDSIGHNAAHVEHLVRIARRADEAQPKEGA